MLNLQYDLVHVIYVSKVVLGVLVVVEHMDDGGGSMACLSDQSTGGPGKILSDDDVLNQRRRFRHFY
jgi:hypothetical protein